MDKVKYFEVEGSVTREVAGKLELYIGDGKFKPYTGDPDRIYRLSHPLTLDDVKTDMGYIDERSRAMAAKNT